jgi:hypothetical protein
VKPVREGGHRQNLRAWYNRAMRFILLVLAATLVVAAGTGCSNTKQAQAPTTSPSSTTNATPTRSKSTPNQSRWAKQVDVVCKPWQKRIDAVRPDPVDTALLQAWLKRVLPLVRKQIAAVEAVKPPANRDEATSVKLFLDSLQKTERALTHYLVAIRENAPAKAQKALDDASAFGKSARARAASLDVTQCGGYSNG